MGCSPILFFGDYPSTVMLGLSLTMNAVNRIVFPKDCSVGSDSGCRWLGGGVIRSTSACGQAQGGRSSAWVVRWAPGHQARGIEV